MNYSPENEQGLLGLVSALKAGMDPTTAYSLITDIENDQATRIANRQQRLGGLAELLMGAAGQGMDYTGASALAEAAPGPAGPAVQNMLGSLYPETYEPTRGNLIMGSAGEPIPTQQSPVFQQDPMAQLQQTAAASEAQSTIQTAANEQAISAASVELASDAAKYAASGRSMQEFIQFAMPAYPEFFATPEGAQMFQSIISTAYAGAGTTGG